MKSLYESLLDDFTELNKNLDVNAVKNEIKGFLKQNFKGVYRISKTPDENGKFVVDSKQNITVINYNITSLTNGMFVFGEIGGEFSCRRCKQLESLEGAPRIAGKFNCTECDSLKSLEGAPEIVDYFYCGNCKGLESFKGAPKECILFDCKWSGESGKGIQNLEGIPTKVKEIDLRHIYGLKTLKGCPTKIEDFSCIDMPDLVSIENGPKEVAGNCSYSGCPNLKSLKGSPKKVGESFGCSDCYALKNFEGAPEEIGESFHAVNCFGIDTNDPNSLKGFPKKVGGDVRVDAFKQIQDKIGITSWEPFKKEDVEKVCHVGGSIHTDVRGQNGLNRYGVLI